MKILTQKTSNEGEF